MTENDRKPESSVSHGLSDPSFVVPFFQGPVLIPCPQTGPRLNAGLVVFLLCPCVQHRVLEGLLKH